jgi:DNA-binding response OmpR family regulator
MQDNTSRTKPYRILAVDDDAAICEIYRLAFQDENYITDVVDGGRKAKQLLTEKQYDLIIADFMMPDTDGYKLLQWIRDNHITSKFILISAYINRGIDHAFKLLKADAVMSKPFTMSGLISLVETMRGNVLVKTASSLNSLSHPSSEQALRTAKKTSPAEEPDVSVISREAFDTLEAIVNDVPNLVACGIFDLRTMECVNKLSYDESIDPEKNFASSIFASEIKRRGAEGELERGDVIELSIVVGKTGQHLTSFQDNKFGLYLITRNP